MQPIRVLVTGAGAPGFWGTFKSLVNNYDNREVHIVATDAKKIDGCMARQFYQIPMANEEGYLDTICKIYQDEKIDILLPQNTMELETLANSEMNVCVSKRVGIANNKSSLYKIAKDCKVPIPKSMRINGKAVIKPVVGHGSKGLKIIEDGEWLVSEFIEGDEYTIDCYRDNEQFIAIPRIRDEIKNGISWETTTVERKDLIEYSKRLAEELDLKYAFGFQFIGDKLLECNPRVQGTMITSTFAGANLIYSAVKSAFGEKVPKLKAEWGTKVIRQSVCKPLYKGY